MKKEHASWLFKLIGELKKKSDESFDEIKVDAVAQTVFGDTAQNLKAAIASENYEHTKMYPEFADVAEKESFQRLPKDCVRSR